MGNLGAREKLDLPEPEGPNGKHEKECGQPLGEKTGSQLIGIKEMTLILQLQGTKFSQHPECAKKQIFP